MVRRGENTAEGSDGDHSERNSDDDDNDDASSYSTGSSRSSYEDDSRPSSFYSSQRSSSRRSYSDEEDVTSRSASSGSRSGSDYSSNDDSRSSRSYTENGQEEESRSSQSYSKSGEEKEEESDSYYDDHDEYSSYEKSMADDESRSSRSDDGSEPSDSFPASSTEDDDDYTSGTDSTYHESLSQMHSSMFGDDETESFASPQRQQSSSFSFQDQQSKKSLLSSSSHNAWPSATSASSASLEDDDVDAFFGDSHASSQSFGPPEEEDPFATESPKSAGSGDTLDADGLQIPEDVFRSKSQSTSFLIGTGFDASSLHTDASRDQPQSQSTSFLIGTGATENVSNDDVFGDQSPTKDASVSSSRKSHFSRKAPTNQPSGDFFGSFSSGKSEDQDESQKSATNQSMASRSSPGSRSPSDPDGANAGAASLASSVKSAQSKSNRDFEDPFGIEPKRSTSTDFGSFSDAPSKASSKLASKASDTEKKTIDLFSSEDPFAATEFEKFDEGATSVFSTASKSAAGVSDDGFTSFSRDTDEAYFGSSRTSHQSAGSKSQLKEHPSKHSHQSQGRALSAKSTSKNDDRSTRSSHSQSSSKRSASRRSSPVKSSPRSSVVSKTSSRGSQSSQSGSRKASRMSISEFLPPRPVTTKGSSVVSGLTSKDTLTQTPVRDEPSISLSEVFPPSFPKSTSAAAKMRSEQEQKDSLHESASKSSQSSKGSRRSKSSKGSKKSSRSSKSSLAKVEESEILELIGRSSAASVVGSDVNTKSDKNDSMSFDSALMDSSKNDAGFSSFAGSASGLGTIMEAQDAAASNQPAFDTFGASFNFDDQRSGSAFTSSKGDSSGSRSADNDPSKQSSQLETNDESLSGLSLSRSSWSKTTTKPSEGSDGYISDSSDSEASSRSSYSTDSRSSQKEGTESSKSSAFSESKHTTSSHSPRSQSPSPPSRTSQTDGSVVDSKQDFQTSHASSDSGPSFMSESVSFGSPAPRSESSSRGRSSPSSSNTNSQSSYSRSSASSASSRNVELSPRSLRSRASSFGQDSRSFSRRSSHVSATDQSRRSAGSNGRSGRSARSRTSSSNRRRVAPQSAGDSSREDESKSSRSSLLPLGQSKTSESGRVSPVNIVAAEKGSPQSDRSSSQRSMMRTHVKGSSSSSQRSRSGRKRTGEEAERHLPDVFFYGKSISLLKDVDSGLVLKNKEIHATVSCDKYRHVVSLAYRKLSDLRPRIQYIISEAEWVHVHILLLYARLFDCELHYHNITLPEEFQIEIPLDLNVLEPIACALASVGIVKDDQNGVTYVPVAKPFNGKSDYTPHNPEDVTEFLEWTAKDSLGYDWNASWEEVERERSKRKQLALEHGIKLPENKSKRDKERHEEKLLDWNLLAIEKWLGYDDELWFCYHQASHILSRVAEFSPNPRDLKTGSYAWLLPREENEQGDYFVRVPRPSLTADTWMIALMFNFCALPRNCTSTWYFQSKALKNVDSVTGAFLDAALKQRKPNTANNASTLEQ